MDHTMNWRLKLKKPGRESTIERYARKRIKAVGGKMYKFVSPGYAGMPDDIAVMPGALIWWVEFKAKGKKPRPLQAARHAELWKFGFRVRVIDSKEAADRLIFEMSLTYETKRI